MNTQAMVTFLADGGGTRDLLREVIGAGGNRRSVAMLLRQLGCVEPHVRYLCGPVISQTPQQAQAIPNWLTPAILLERLDLIFDEIANGIVGFLAGPTDVLAYLHPVGTVNEANWEHIWSKVYLCVKNEITRKNTRNAPWELVNPKTGQPACTLQVDLSQAEAGEYYALANMLRRRVVEKALPGEPLTYPWNIYPNVGNGNGNGGPHSTFEALFRSKELLST